MRPSRGMGAIMESKVPKNGTNVPKKGTRKDGCVMKGKTRGKMV